MPITFSVMIVSADGRLIQRRVDAFSAEWAEKVTRRSLPEGAVVLYAVPA